MSVPEMLLRAALIGIGGTVVLDLYAWLLQRTRGIPATNWAMVGRWIGHMREGWFVQQELAKAHKIPGELAIGWAAHYVIGIGYGLLLVAIVGSDWLRAPTLGAPIALAIVLLLLPYFVMMPGMGLGVAASRTPKPNAARLKSAAGHSVFGLGMYLASIITTAMLA